MGSDFSFIIIVKKESKNAIESFLNLHSDDKISLNKSADDCLCINFPIDSFVLKYLEGGYDYNVHNSPDEIRQFIRDNTKARIGCIYFTEMSFDDSEELCKYKFTAATSDMSFLFEESLSIRAWFVELSKTVDAIISYMDLEYNGNRIIYFNGKEIDILLKDDSYFSLTPQEFCNAIFTFSKSAKDYFRDTSYD